MVCDGETATNACTHSVQEQRYKGGREREGGRGREGEEGREGGREGGRKGGRKRGHVVCTHSTSWQRKRENSRMETCPSGVRSLGSNGAPTLEGTRAVTC